MTFPCGHGHGGHGHGGHGGHGHGGHGGHGHGWNTVKFYTKIYGI